MTRALVTRPKEDSADLIRALEQRGIEVLAEPLLTIRRKAGIEIDTKGVQALLFTSANGARAFAETSPIRELPALAVGDATATALRDLGFARVDSAGGDVEDLERLARRRLDPTRGKLLHAAGSSVAGDLSGRLQAAGFEVERVQLYDADPADALSETARAEIAAGRIDWVLVFSPRTAATFASVIERAGLAEAARKMTLVALSEAVAKATSLAFRRVAVAAEPTQAALLATVDGLTAKPPMTETRPAAPTEKRSRFVPIAATAIVAAAAIAAAIVLTREKPATVAVPVDLSPVLQRLDRIEASVAALGQRVDGVAGEARQAGAKASAAAEAAAARPADAPTGAAPVDLGPIEQKLAGLERALADVSRRATASSDTEKRLAEVERLAKAERNVDAAALAALKLGDALNAGRPYKAELALLANTPGIEAEVKILMARAETGVSSRASLVERFPAAAAAAARDADRGDDLLSQAIAKLKGLVQIRRVAPGDDLDGRLASAEMLLKAGDLAAALAVLDGLPEGAVRALAPWRADAQARLEAERALDRATLAVATARAG
jgi:uroporphyrinogen-III synthase